MRMVRITRHIFILTAAASVLLPGKLMAQADPYLSGRACMLREEFRPATGHLEQAVRQGVQLNEALLNLGICHFRLNEFPAAREKFYELEKRKPGMGSLWLARTEVRLSHPGQAMKYLREHLDSPYRLPESEILLDEDISSLEAHAGWKALWKEKQWYTESDHVFSEALYLGKNGEELEALNRLSSLERTGYNVSLVQQKKAEIYLKVGNQKAARASLQSALKADIRNQDARYLLAGLYLENEKYEEAGNELDILIRRQPDRFEAYLLRASARGKTGNLKGAEEDLETYSLYFPESHEAVYRKGLLQYENGKYLDAIGSFNRALDMHTGNADYYLARGRTYAATGTLIYAEKDLSMALDLDPLNGETWMETARLAERMGRKQKACDCYRKAHKLGIFEAGEKVERLCR